MKRTLSIFFFIYCFLQMNGQPALPKTSNVAQHTQAQMVDSTEGVMIYTKMMKVLEMDHELFKENGLPQGWNEEYYDSGKLANISYYKEGKLVLYKNFFENGQCHHNVSYSDVVNCNIDVYYESGVIKNQLQFVNGLPVKLMDFFPNSLPKCSIEFDEATQMLNSKHSWYINAENQSEIIQLDAKEKRYFEKVYYPNGQLREEGELIYSPETKEYIKAGTWKIYESSGKKKSSEKFKFSLSSN